MTGKSTARHDCVHFTRFVISPLVVPTLGETRIPARGTYLHRYVPACSCYKARMVAASTLPEEQDHPDRHKTPSLFDD